MTFFKRKSNALKSAFVLIALLLTSGSQYSQSSVLSSGGDFKSSKASFSYSVGQILTTQDLSNSTSLFGEKIILSHGVQQVFLQTCNKSTKVEIIATPNPSNGIVTLNLINWDEKEIQYNVFDTLGKTVLSSSISDDQTKLDLSFLSSGIYIISLGYHCGSINSFKILINNR
ncbi:T9SS type A sorting domain-containing protein [Flavobacteriaceae bacterium]|nr:T9SS type A sorting domain-containing protein [Flavobacteriaceae bacterium]MDB4093150.1 T9SS type A sorting domain-containing protein [Flavobacteriaceae bacterium]